MKLNTFFFFASSEGITELTTNLPAQYAVQMGDFSVLSSILCLELSNRQTVFSPFWSNLIFLLAKEVTSPCGLKGLESQEGDFLVILFIGMFGTLDATL